MYVHISTYLHTYIYMYIYVYVYVYIYIGETALSPALHAAILAWSSHPEAVVPG